MDSEKMNVKFLNVLKVKCTSRINRGVLRTRVTS